MESVGSFGLWAGFLAFVLGMLALDLGVFHRQAHKVSMKEAGIWSGIWVILALAFSGFITHRFGIDRGTEFLTGYLIEKALSIDNIFIFVMLFGAFKVPEAYQHRVLFWGILGALVMRAIFVALGAALIASFHWVLYIFGLFLIITGIKMLIMGGSSFDPMGNPIFKLIKKWIPTTDQYHGPAFTITAQGKRLATPLLIVLLAVELTDIIFAVDSVPAIFAVTSDPFIVFTSNIFAILGLRSLYFMLAGVMDRFHFLKIGLSLVLLFVGLKMLMVDLIKVPPFGSLALIGLLVCGSILASQIWPRSPGHQGPKIDE